jgi:serine/threonine protein kinase
MSFQTKLALLTIIIRTLRYLRDCGVVYNNLRPSTIFVKKGLIPKLSDFTNAYHESVTPMQESFKDHFPYVSILKSFYRTYSFEKSDSMSFGALAFEAVFGKPIKYVRSSVSARLRAEERHQIIAKGEAFAIENCN